MQSDYDWFREFLQRRHDQEKLKEAVEELKKLPIPQKKSRSTFSIIKGLR